MRKSVVWRTLLSQDFGQSSGILLTWIDFEMETPPRGRKPQTPAAAKQVHARLKRQMESEMDVEGNPEMERMGDEAPVHAAAIKPLADDYDDDDLA
ncbi:hypothetical protein PR003_g8279 [Phytophthora rubi]|uniref:Uncharacterized protein n=1 Tax=Phytophthora rubi TaxID=129364 RepID=A0A6A3N0N2_9STRA|nr:hypothetical protein PR002_g8008 [Phytophthora rubi]KAE9039019.1 hypothetical protein PR001_g7701 [Phytophthora rubi]KAE9344781.1 hypothetical protein PR003_g8279 [Phytophthora rubi]